MTWIRCAHFIQRRSEVSRVGGAIDRHRGNVHRNSEMHRSRIIGDNEACFFEDGGAFPQTGLRKQLKRRRVASPNLPNFRFLAGPPRKINWKSLLYQLKPELSVAL